MAQEASIHEGVPPEIRIDPEVRIGGILTGNVPFHLSCCQVHVNGSLGDDGPENRAKISELRSLLLENPLFREHDAKGFCTEHTLRRFLIARNWNVEIAAQLLEGCLMWRTKRQPYWVLSEPESAISKEFEHESVTGKIQVPGTDRWGRAVLIFDNSVQNTTGHDAQMRFLAWNMELCYRTMQGGSDKICLFMHLNNFSFFNNPPMESTKETIQILCNNYPESLGSCVIYQPPAFFSGVYSAVKFLIDPKTRSKFHFINGDVSTGSLNDRKLCYLIGDNWRTITGATLEAVETRPSAYHRRDIQSALGFRHESYWRDVLEREKKWTEAHPKADREPEVAPMGAAEDEATPERRTKRQDNMAEDVAGKKIEDTSYVAKSASIPGSSVNWSASVVAALIAIFFFFMSVRIEVNL